MTSTNYTAQPTDKNGHPVCSHCDQPVTNGDDVTVDGAQWVNHTSCWDAAYPDYHDYDCSCGDHC